ncbi:MAG: radical SAM protein [Bryobacteraceae bacterium]|nr:radical SAM protein [Bryobacteraceae bacterium]
MLIHGFVSGNRVNGPGLRAVVFFQGCTLHCRFCWNPKSHAFIGDERSVAEVARWVLCAHEESPLDGVTFSGGEPMQQADALLELIESFRDLLPSLSFGMYSGYSEQELADGRYWCRSELTRRAKQEIWRLIRRRLDFGVLGRYVASRPTSLPLRTSANQKLVLFSERYREQDFEPQEAEVHIAAHGLVQVTGFPMAGLPV